MLAALALAGAAGTAMAQPATPEAPIAPIASLRQAFDAAWQRQPEAQAASARREAAEARRRIAESWSADAPALELSARSDRLSGNDGQREYEIGVAVPLWLQGERAHSAALAEAELRAAESRTLAARLRVAATVRDAWWSLQRAAAERALAAERLAQAQALAGDVARRVRAGELARADGHQAEAALAAAEAARAEAELGFATSTRQLRVLLGAPLAAALDETVEAPPEAETTPPIEAERAGGAAAAHPAAAELADRAEAARRATALASVQSRANPELTLAATRERDASDERYGNSLTLGLRIPLGSGARHQARLAEANAERIEAEARLAQARDELAGELALARARLETARLQRDAAERRARLAAETRGFFEKSFRLGETDLPTRLRVELEAFEAEHQLALARIESARAVSGLRQALGLLPE